MIFNSLLVSLSSVYTGLPASTAVGRTDLINEGTALLRKRYLFLTLDIVSFRLLILSPAMMSSSTIIWYTSCWLRDEQTKHEMRTGFDCR